MSMQRMVGRAIIGGREVCPECWARGHVENEPAWSDETYDFATDYHDGRIENRAWNIKKARELIAARPRKPRVLEPEGVYSWLTTCGGLTLDHVAHIPPDKLREPGILVIDDAWIDVPYVGRTLVGKMLLIDGSHRAAAALKAMEPFSVYVLTSAEQASICTYSMNGVEQPLPAELVGTTDDEQAEVL